MSGLLLLSAPGWNILSQRAVVLSFEVLASSGGEYSVHAWDVINVSGMDMGRAAGRLPMKVTPGIIQAWDNPAGCHGDTLVWEQPAIFPGATCWQSALNVPSGHLSVACRVSQVLKAQSALGHSNFCRV